ncbi:HNH endonuclease [Rhodococcus phage ReqiDocB7]|uniref:HNH endonuclease n=1 Tax=Rhodococcus phage ReqiDocB7 TaxID=691966 RepID=UPI0001CDD84F|nr:HNH endonuclease [Rhodococcus phage ReqiDocB7]ADD80840.1 HNH endonuclease [Rhodococcus phage ReqiDocB7]
MSRRKSVTPARRGKVYAKYGTSCFLRGTYCTGGGETMDHWMPLSKGGKNKSRNMRPACANCNNEKGNMTPEQWLIHMVRSPDEVRLPLPSKEDMKNPYEFMTLSEMRRQGML